MAGKIAPSELEDHLGYWLRYVSNHVSHSFSTKVEGQGVTVAEWVLLRAMFNAKALNPSQLAEVVGMSRGTISKLVERLSQKNLVVRTFSEDDRRYQQIELSRAGKRLVPTLARLADENDREHFGHLTAEKKRVLLRLLQAMVRQHGWKEVPID